MLRRAGKIAGILFWQTLRPELELLGKISERDLVPELDGEEV